MKFFELYLENRVVQYKKISDIYKTIFIVIVKVSLQEENQWKGRFTNETETFGKYQFNGCQPSFTAFILSLDVEGELAALALHLFMANCTARGNNLCPQAWNATWWPGSKKKKNVYKLNKSEANEFN